MKKPDIKDIYLASPRGFCAGVERAVDILERVLKKYGPPVYSRHAIVHNSRVVRDFEKKGVIFKENINNIPYHSRVVFSAHGSPPEFYKIAKKKKLNVIDAMCPLVLKVHLEAKKYEKLGYFIFYIGHKEHPEPEGVIGNVKPESIILLESIDGVKKANPKQKNKLIVLTQTTLSFDDTKVIIQKLKKKFPKLLLPPAFDICYATQNRQFAVKILAKKTDLILVVGSNASSNSKRLKEVAEQEGKKTYMIDDITQIKNEWFKNINKVGITAGASSPEKLINEVIERIKNNKTKIHELIVVKEKIYFPRPTFLD